MPSKAHCSKACGTELQKVTEVKLEQPAKAHLPMVWTEVGITTEVSAEHLEKAPFSIVVTDSGMMTSLKLEHDLKALNADELD